MWHNEYSIHQMIICIKEFKYFYKEDELQSNYLATIPASWKWVLQRKALLTISREKNCFLSIKTKMLKHMKRKSKRTRGTCTHIKSAQAEMEIVKPSERNWENWLKNKNTFTFSGKGWRSLCVSLPQASPVSLSPVCLQLSGYHNHLHRTQLQPSTASHVSLTHTHPCVHITPHASPDAAHHTPHSVSPHPRSASWLGWERTGTARIKIRACSERETNEQGPATQSAMHFLLRTGCDFRNVTDPSHSPCVKTHLPQTMSRLETKAFLRPVRQCFIHSLFLTPYIEI